MGQMGAGIADAYARAGQITGQAYQNLGSQIGGALTQAAGAYVDYKKQQSQVKAQEKALDAFMPYLPKEMQQTIGEQRAAMANESVADRAAYNNTMMSLAGNAVAQHFQMQKIGAEQGGATGRTILAEAGATERTKMAEAAAAARQTESLGSAMERARMENAIQYLNNPNMLKIQQQGAFTTPQPFGIGTAVGGGIYIPR